MPIQKRDMVNVNQSMRESERECYQTMGESMGGKERITMTHCGRDNHKSKRYQ
jgi:hypothetical protein